MADNTPENKGPQQPLSFLRRKVSISDKDGNILEIMSGSGAAKVSASDNYELEIARGNVSGVSFIHKFGEAGDIDMADGFADIWDGATDSISGFSKTSTYTFSTSADIDSLSSSDNGDTVDIEVHGLDTNWDIVVQTITLTGRTRVALTTDLIRVYRMINVGSTPLAGNVFCYKDGALTNGVPDTEADVRAIIQIGNEQSLMAIYSVPNGVTAYMSDFYASVSKKQTVFSIIKLRIRPFGQVFQLKHNNTVITAGTSRGKTSFDIPEVIEAKSDIIISADTSADNNAISAGFDLILVDN